MAEIFEVHSQEMGENNSAYRDDEICTQICDDVKGLPQQLGFLSEEDELEVQKKIFKKAMVHESFIKVISKQRAVLYALICAFITALAAMATASLSGSIDPNEINFIRMFIQLLACLPVAVNQRIHFRYSRSAYVLLLMRCVIGAFNSTLIFFIYQIIPVANAKAIQYSAPIFAGLLGCILLKESCSFVETILSLVTLGGVILVAQPPFLFENVESVETVSEAGVLGSLLSLLSAFLSALTFIVLRKLSTYRMPAITILTIYSIVGMIISATMTTALRQWTVPGCGLDRFALIGNGILLVMTQALEYLALKIERASTVGLVLSSDVLFSFVLEFAIFGVVPNFLTVIGALVIMASLVGLTVKKLCTREKESEDYREGEGETNTTRTASIRDQKNSTDENIKKS